MRNTDMAWTSHVWLSSRNVSPVAGLDQVGNVSWQSPQSKISTTIMARDRCSIKLGEGHAKLSSTCCFEVKKQMRNCISQLWLPCCHSFKCHISFKKRRSSRYSWEKSCGTSYFQTKTQGGVLKCPPRIWNLTQVSKLQFNQRTWRWRSNSGT